jgi:chemotaxis response regulator CheB
MPMLPLHKRRIRITNKREIMTIKRVILASHSRLLREMFHRVIDQADHLEVVREVQNSEELLFVVQAFCPDWVILSLPLSDEVVDYISTSIQSDPSVRFIFFSEDHRSLKVDWQMTSEAEISDVSLKEFIHLLEKDLQHI